VVDVSESVDMAKLTVGKRVTLLSDSYKLEKMLPSSVSWLSIRVAMGPRL
jgi:26S proteasome regulatory subunit T6